MAIIGSFDTTTLEGLVTTMSKAVKVANAPLGEAAVFERNKRIEAVEKARIALDAYIASIV